MCKKLCQEGQEAILIHNLKVFLCAIMNFKEKWMMVEEQVVEGEEETAQKGKVDKDNVGTFNDGQLQLRDAEINWINKHFCLMHANRQDYTLNNKKVNHLQKTLAAQPQNQFRPQTCKASQKILEKKNPKEQLGEGMTYHDYLI